MGKLTAVVLTWNEERHIERCLSRLHGVVDEVLVVDCYSTDQTTWIAKSAGARVVERRWVNHADQFNWALTQLARDTEWVLRVDADEYLSADFVREIKHRLLQLEPATAGVACRRKVVFQGQPISFGAVSGVTLRLFRNGKGRSELRWMDEHIRVDGPVVRFRGAIVDENLNSLTWWTAKHNNYASREAVEMLALEFGLELKHEAERGELGRQAARKRWVKERVYARLPAGARALVYFLYRYVVKLGFLDRGAGATFHILQGFWYRYLVDAKIREVKRYMKDSGSDVRTAIDNVLGFQIE